MQTQDASSGWNEQISRMFLDYGRYFVPERERQLQIVVDLVPPLDQPFTVVELCCGEGLLAEALLERWPTCTVQGLDGSPEMLRRAQERLAPYGGRFQAKLFDLAEKSWRKAEPPVHAAVSSLSIHHLEGPQKRTLFCDVYHMLARGGVFVIADLVEPAHPRGRDLSARAWDEAVRARSLEIDGHPAAFDFFERERWNTYRYLDPEDIDKPSRIFSKSSGKTSVRIAQTTVYGGRAQNEPCMWWPQDASTNVHRELLRRYALALV